MLLVEYAHGLPGEQLVAGRLGDPIKKLTLEELKIPALVIEKLASPGKQPGV
ncbi:MAG: hypothetical protein HY653_08750 [Acidobacteria bacterium]|nr:hypothetical protein [Acidobacteriota bacterium]